MGTIMAADPTKPLRWGFIGSGPIAYSMAADLALSGTGRLVSVTSRTHQNAVSLARSFAATPVETSTELINDKNIDVVYIATPPATHAELAIQALNAGKHVLIEKPFATSVEEAHRIAEAAKRSGTFCMEAMWMRFLPTIEHTLAAVRAGNLGDVPSLVCDFSYAVAPSEGHHLFQKLGGGVLLDRAVYGIALSHSLFGPVSAVTGSVSYGENGVDEDVSLTLRHTSKSTSAITASCRVTGTNTAQIRGTSATLTLHEPFFGATRVTTVPTYPQVLGAKPRPTSLASKLTELPLATKPGVQSTVRRIKGFAKANIHEMKSTQLTTLGAGYAHQLQAVTSAIASGLHEEPRWTLADSIEVLRVIELAHQIPADVL
jgi:predicted dehydrogenase